MLTPDELASYLAYRAAFVLACIIAACIGIGILIGRLF